MPVQETVVNLHNKRSVTHIIKMLLTGNFTGISWPHYHQVLFNKISLTFFGREVKQPPYIAAILASDFSIQQQIHPNTIILLYKQ